MTFSSVADIKNYVMQQSKNALIKSQEQVYEIINRFVKEFYAGYSPEMYDRTYQLYRSLVKTDVESTGNGWKAYIYFDYSSLVYMTGLKPTGEQVMKAAARGDHGADGLLFIPNGDSIWNEPIAILKTEAYEILKRNLIDSGIPIK